VSKRALTVGAAVGAVGAMVVGGVFRPEHSTRALAHRVDTGTGPAPDTGELQQFGRAVLIASATTAATLAVLRFTSSRSST